MAKQEKHDSCILVVFGATGDLTHRKIIPALYNLLKKNELPKGFALVGVARRPYKHEEFRAEAKEAILQFVPDFDEKLWDNLAGRIYYQQLEFEQDSKYKELSEFLAELDTKHGTQKNRIFYLATPPDYFGTIALRLKKHDLAQTSSNKPWHRVVFEKPFGNDLDSAKNLNSELGVVFSESQIYRIDHYLGKELVQNVIVLRFANGMFDPLWNRKYIDHVQITASESGGVGTRGGYYDSAGALKDMVQNHLLQLLSLVAMEAPITLDAKDIQAEKVKVLRSLMPKDPEKIQSVRGQYIDGTAEGQEVKSYRDEEKVSKDSQTETFVSLKLEIQNGRWQGVPFYLRTGKHMAASAMEIVIRFKATPIPLFQNITFDENRLVIRIQPQEGIALHFNAKVPGTELKLQPVRMDFSHTAAFGPNTPEAYERLLHDVMLGDSTLFTSWDEVQHAWEFTDIVAKSWEAKKVPLLFYAPGTWGPNEADEILSKEGHTWIAPISSEKPHTP